MPISRLTLTSQPYHPGLRSSPHLIIITLGYTHQFLPQTKQFWRAKPALWDPCYTHTVFKLFLFAQSCFAHCFTGVLRLLTSKPLAYKSQKLKVWFLENSTYYSWQYFFRKTLSCFQLIIIKFCCSCHSAPLYHILEPYLVISTSRNTACCSLPPIPCLWTCSFSSLWNATSLHIMLKFLLFFSFQITTNSYL